MSTMLPHEKYTRPRILTGPEAVDLIVNIFLFFSWVSLVRVADFSVGL